MGGPAAMFWPQPPPSVALRKSQRGDSPRSGSSGQRYSAHVGQGVPQKS